MKEQIFLCDLKTHVEEMEESLKGLTDAVSSDDNRSSNGTSDIPSISESSSNYLEAIATYLDHDISFVCGIENRINSTRESLGALKSEMDEMRTLAMAASINQLEKRAEEKAREIKEDKGVIRCVQKQAKEMVDRFNERMR